MDICLMVGKAKTGGLWSIKISMRFNFENINSIRSIVREGLHYQKSGTALDLGCGAGRHSLFLAKKGFRVVAVDKSSENLAALKELARIQKLPIITHKADVATYKPSKKFDFIISTMVLHFLPYRIQKESILTMQSNTKKNGINIISNYSTKNKKGTRPNLVKAVELKKQYVDTGWDILHYKERLSGPMTTSFGGNKTVRYWIVELIAQKS